MKDFNNQLEDMSLEELHQLKEVLWNAYRNMSGSVTVNVHCAIQLLTANIRYIIEHLEYKKERELQETDDEFVKNMDNNHNLP